MKKAVIIGPDKTVNTLYQLNLNVYIGLDVEVALDKESSLSLLKKNIERGQLIIIGLCLENLKWAFDLYEEYKNKKSTYILFYNLKGDPKIKNNISLDMLYVDNKYDLRSIIRTCARLLKITAQDMVNLDVGKFFPIPVELVSWTKVAQWDLFVLEGANYLIRYKKGETIDCDIKDHSYLYVPSIERLNCINHISANLILHIQNATPSQRVKAAEISYETILSQFTKNPKDFEKITAIVKVCVEAIDSLMKESSDLERLLKFLTDNKSSFLFTHTVLISYISKHILSNLNWGNETQIEKLALASYFHDIYLVPIYQKYPDLVQEEDLLFNDKLNDDDKELVVMHAKIAGEKISQLPHLPIGVDSIIVQHHGNKFGEGINIGPSDEISPLAKVMQISESFASAFLECIRQKKEFKRDEYVTLMYQQFNKRSYKSIIEPLKSI